MHLTEALRKWARDNLGVKDGSSDDDYKSAVSKGLLDGKLTADKLAELSKVKSDGEQRLQAMVSQTVADAIKGLDIGAQVTNALKGLNLGGQTTQTTQAGQTAQTTAQQGTQQQGGGTDQGKAQQDMINEAVKSAVQGLNLQAAHNEASPHFLLTRGAAAQGGVEAHTVRVKKAVEQYSSARSAAVYPAKYHVRSLQGAPVTHMDRALNLPSQQDKAVIGAVSKWMWGALHGQGRPFQKMTDHDKDVFEYALHEVPWTGFVGGDGDGYRETPVDCRRLNEMERKALLNDAVSGGVYAVPVVYDDTAILAPIQTGELYPLVQTIPIARGRVVKAFSVGTPVLSTGIPEGTPIPLFDTTGFIAGLDTTIYPVTGAVEVGLDFEEDSPANFGQLMIDRYGLKHLEWLDNMVALGDGATQPLGLFNTGSMAIVASANGLAGPLTLADMESLIFGVNRAYRRARGGKMAFVMNDVTYRRFRAIATATNWNTRLFGTNYEDYSFLGYPVRIIPGVPNNKIAFVNLDFFRMYRRQGLQVKVTTEGKDLSLRNMRLIIVRALWGGRLFEGGAGAIMVDAQS